MAGFLDGSTSNNLNILNRIKGPIKKLMNAGREYEDLILDNKLGVGEKEARAIKSGFGDEENLYIASTYDMNSNNSKKIGYYEQDYAAKVSHLRQMATHREIDKFLVTIADEAIVYDDNGFFAKAHTSLLDDLDDGVEDEIKEDLSDNFEHIYTNVFNFKNNASAWRYFKKLLIDGILAFELVYNKEGDRIIGSVPLDPTQIVPHVIMNNGKWQSVWILYPGDSQLERILPDTHVVYISYGFGDDFEDISYVQGLLRSFNLYRTIENTAVMWNIMNSSFRLKTIVPVSGGRSKNEQAVGEILGRFREDIQIDNNSGEVRVDGQPSINLFRNYAIASKAGKQTEIEAINFTGYDMSDPNLLKYWRDKLYDESYIPFTRLQRDGGAVFNSNTEGMEREEMRFGKYINRLRSIFREILVKPLYIQMCLDHPNFKEDEYFKSKIGVKFHKENMFELYWTRENMKKDVEFISTMMNIQDDEGKPFFNLELIIEQYTTFDYDFLLKNKEIKEELEKKGKEDKSKAEGGGGEDDLSLDDIDNDSEIDLGLDTEGGGGDLGLDTGGTDDLGLDTGDTGDIDLDLT